MAIPRNLANIAPSVAGNSDGVTGITFAATQSASADANTLDDYEEGTWTPTILFGGNGVGQSYTFQLGAYTKIGRMVQLNFFVLLSNKGSSTGAMSLGGAPFSPTSYFSGAVDVHNTTYTGQYVMYGFGLTQVTEGGTQTNLTNSNASNSSVITGTINYIIA